MHLDWGIEVDGNGVGVDGRLLGVPVGSYRITIEQEVLNFLIPD